MVRGYCPQQMLSSLLYLRRPTYLYGPLVSALEVRNFILQSKSGEAPGTDNIPSEMLKDNLDWWVPVLMALFTLIDCEAQIPND